MQRKCPVGSEQFPVALAERCYGGLSSQPFALSLSKGIVSPVCSFDAHNPLTLQQPPAVSAGAACAGRHQPLIVSGLSSLFSGTDSNES